MNTSTRQAENHIPLSPRRRKRSLAIALACVAVIIGILLAGNLLGVFQSKGGGPGKNIRATTSPTPVTIPTWTPTEVTPPAEALFYDTFVNNSHGWSLLGNNGYFRILVNNTLILADTNPGTTLIESVPTSTNMDDYVISTDFTINRAGAHDSIGLYLRGDSTLSHDYRIDINGDMTFDVAKEWLDPNQAQPAQTTMLVSPTRTSYLKPMGQQNTLTAIMLGDTLTVILNNDVLTTVSDPSYTSGQIALFAHHNTSSQGVNVSFSRVEIDRVASPFPTPTPSPTLTPSPS